MIVYNAGSKFFDMQADAKEHCKELGIKWQDGVNKISITNREELAEFLNAIFVDAQPVDMDTPEVTQGVQPHTPSTETLKMIPHFMRKDIVWRDYYKGRTDLDAS